ncbi:MAG: transcription antitermination factor NusB [Thermomicrobiales bacterium]
MPQERPPSDEKTARRDGKPGDGSRRGRAERRHRADKPSVSVHRHQARILALQVIYEVDVTDHGLDEVIARTLHDPEETTPPEVQTYAERLARGVAEHGEQIDVYIADAAPAFPVPQLASVDRNVLRLAIYELLHQRDVPIKAAINEAVELAKRYGGLNSSRFVNGVLGTVLTSVEREQAFASDPPPAPGDESTPPTDS